MRARLRGVLDRRGIILFDFREPGIGKVEGDPDQWRPVRASPLITQIDWRPEIEPLRGKLFVELPDELFEQRSAYLETNVRDTLRQERVTLAFPVGRCFFHVPDSGKLRTH